VSLDRTFCVRFAEGECINWQCSWAVSYRHELEEKMRHGLHVSWADRRTEDCGYVPSTKENEK
jgi:hypothetical protein